MRKLATQRLESIACARFRDSNRLSGQWPDDRICSTFNVPMTTGCWIMKFVVWVARLAGALALLCTFGCTTPPNPKEPATMKDEQVAI